MDAQVVRVLASARGFLHQLVELLHKNHSLELLHPIVAAASEERLCALEAPGGASDVVERVAPVQEFIAVAGDGAAFSGGDMLGVLETETGQVAEYATLAALVFSKPGLAGILDNGEFVFAGDRVDRVHVARHAVDMHRQDGAGSFGDPAFDRRRVHGERGRFGVGEHRQGFVDQDRVIGGDECVRGDDDFVAGIHVHDVQADQQGGRTARGGQAAFGAEQFRVTRLELRHVPAIAAVPFAAAQDFEDRWLP